MFTGIIEDVGMVTGIEPGRSGSRVRIDSDLAPALRPGDSLAVNGVCLTIVAAAGRQVDTDIGPETRRVTTLGALVRGGRVNLERPLKADGRLDGHFVLGHVDGVGTVVEVRPDGESFWIGVEYPVDLETLFIHKGSVSVDGVSLTVAALAGRRFDVQVIPYTWSHTTIGSWRPGEKVNLECDVIGKYVLRALAARRT
jgi:riboflavin synthase